MNLSYLKDKDFLKSLDEYNNKTFWVKLEILDSDEQVIGSIEGRAQPGSVVSISGSSSVRRTCNISIIAQDTDNDLTNINNLLSANKKIKILEGLKNDFNSYYDKVIWFSLGIFIIVQPNITFTNNGCIINLNCKDKMCLLNGECGGGLPTSIIFDYYDQIIGALDLGNKNAKIMEVVSEPNNYTIYKLNNKYWQWTEISSWEEITKDQAKALIGSRVAVRQKLYDIIQTLVCNYGHESLERIFITDVPLKIKQIVRYVGSGTLYYNTATKSYTFDSSQLINEGTWREFSYNEDVGYVYTDFVYPAKKGGLTSAIGDNVCTVLDKIKNILGNYEYFYDVEGNFIFQEKKNYLNNSYDPVDTYRLDNYGKENILLKENGLCILDNASYKVDFYSNTKSIYTFNEGNGLILSFTNNPNYTNLKNDFHIWGENGDKRPIHYHLAIKRKPLPPFNTYSVVYLKDNNGDYTGGIRLATFEDNTDSIDDYVPNDWRAELYCQGLTKQQKGIRPDIYEQELLDLFDEIYNFKDKKFKTENVEHPNDLMYFFDFLEPKDDLADCSVDVLGSKVYSYKQNKLNRLYNTEIPDTIMIDMSMDVEAKQELINDCLRMGQPYSNVSDSVYKNIAEGTIGYTAQEVARDLLYQYTGYNESISLTSVPIYYLDVNTRITVQDSKSGIYGDYIINNISLPLDASGTMSISASRALERI